MDARASGRAALHPADASPFLGSDVYRLSATVEGDGWSAALQHALVAVEAGRSVTVPVYVGRVTGAKPGRVVITAVSESDPTKLASVTVTVR